MRDALLQRSQRRIDTLRFLQSGSFSFGLRGTLSAGKVAKRESVKKLNK
jgi:hypothetical protein